MSSLIILLFSSISLLNAQSNEFTCVKDVNVNTTLQQSALIASFNTQKSKFACIKECNRNTNCVSCSFNLGDATTGNSNDCYLYNRIFNSNDYTYENNVNWYSKKVVVATTTSTPSTTRTIANYKGCNGSLLCLFQGASLNFSLTTYNGTTFSALMSTEMVIINDETFYFMTDSNTGTLVKMSSTWQYISKSSIGSIRVVKWAMDFIYVTAFSGFYKLNYNCSVVKSTIDSGAYYHGMYHNASGNTLVVAINARSRIDIVDADLNVIANMSFFPYKPWSVSGYGDTLYVTATNATSVIYVVRNLQIIDMFTMFTSATQMFSIVVDDHGYMAWGGSSFTKVYHTNGTYTGLVISLPSSVFHINLDFYGRLMMSYFNGFYIYN